MQKYNLKRLISSIILLLIVALFAVSGEDMQLSRFTDWLARGQELIEGILREDFSDEAGTESGKDVLTTTDAAIFPTDSEFAIKFIDVGQADATLVACDGHYMLIDGGNVSDSSKMYTILKDERIEYLDLVVATHAHEDHVGGLAGALNYASAGVVLCPTESYDTKAFESFKKYAEEKSGGITVPDIGDSYQLGSAIVDILGVNAVEGENDSSIILKITYGETAFLFTGDGERIAEQAVLDCGADLSATVIKVGHHGSNTSTIYPFLREVMPQYAVISVGQDNSYGHPAEEVLSRLEDAEVVVYRTDLQGDIICRSNGVSVSFETENRSF